MIMFKLLLIPIFVLVVLALIKFGKLLFKYADSLEVDEKKDDIKHKSELVDDVESYTLHNKGKMRKAASNTLKDFNKS